MSGKVISKVIEIENCPKQNVIDLLYKSKFWEKISPVSKIEAEFVAPNVLFTKITDNIKLINIPIQMEGELVLIDKGEDEEKGRLIEFNVRKNENVKELEGNLRIKAMSPSKSKIGVFIHKFILSSDFMKVFSGTAELTLRSKISDMLRNLEKICKTHGLTEFL